MMVVFQIGKPYLTYAEIPQAFDPSEQGPLLWRQHQQRHLQMISEVMKTLYGVRSTLIIDHDQKQHFGSRPTVSKNEIWQANKIVLWSLQRISRETLVTFTLNNITKLLQQSCQPSDGCIDITTSLLTEEAMLDKS